MATKTTKKSKPATTPKVDLSSTQEEDMAFFKGIKYLVCTGEPDLIGFSSINDVKEYIDSEGDSDYHNYTIWDIKANKFFILESSPKLTEVK